jgi:hypothetical protein
LAINAQQQAQLERIYRQSIGQAANVVPGTSIGDGTISGVQQLQMEFQKLCATTKDTSPGPGGATTATSAAGYELYKREGGGGPYEKIQTYVKS